jgi:hypothetical protein
MSCVFVDAEYQGGGARHEASTPITQDAQPAAIVDASQRAEAITKQKDRWSALPLAQISPERQAFF